MNIFDKQSEKQYETKIIWNGYVVSVNDIKGNGEIKVRIDNIDSNILNTELPPALPLLPLSINQLPKIGDSVLVVMPSILNSTEKAFQKHRYYLLSNSSYVNLDNDPYHFLGGADRRDGFLKLEDLDIVKTEGLYPKSGESALLGKTNSDIILNDENINIRVGKHEKENVNTFNTLDTGYIQLKFGFPEETIEEIVEVTNYQLTSVDALHQFKIIKNSDTNFTVEVLDIKIKRVVYSSIIDENNNKSSIKLVKDVITSLKKRYPQYKLIHTIDELYGIPQEFSKQELFGNKVKTTLTPKQNTGSVINVVADRINLISHLSKSEDKYPKDYTTNTQPDYIEDQTLVNTQTYSMVQGEKLKEFLELMVEFVKNHTHPYSNLPPTQNLQALKITNFDLDGILSDYIKLR